MLTVRHVKRAAESMVALEMGLMIGARQLRGHMQGLPVDLLGEHPAIDALLAEIPERLLLGGPRLFLSEERIREDEATLREIENRHRIPVIMACRRIFFACLRLQHADSGTGDSV